MTKERLIELTDLNFNIGNERDRTAFIIHDLLPAVRDNEEWKREFWDWIDNNNYGNKPVLFAIGELNYEDFAHEWEDIIPDDKMLLGYELEFCREIIGKE